MCVLYTRVYGMCIMYAIVYDCITYTYTCYTYAIYVCYVCVSRYVYVCVYIIYYMCVYARSHFFGFLVIMAFVGIIFMHLFSSSIYKSMPTFHEG